MLLVSPEKIAAVMALAPLPHSFAELDEMVARGLPKGALKASIDHICVSAEARRQLLYRIVPEAYRSSGTTPQHCRRPGMPKAPPRRGASRMNGWARRPAPSCSCPPWWSGSS